eukprot:TRINITY_DN9983_c3_g1_i1.p2 TRINITY_DN9983_c3_g1~~TRINITY_DN9983_c3_g1_i1.p2  ORF type:complete len:406 (+),score=170.22 TRINITY_DN9983_c3_g1_i1:58-1218(+)
MNASPYAPVPAPCWGQTGLPPVTGWQWPFCPQPLQPPMWQPPQPQPQPRAAMRKVVEPAEDGDGGVLLRVTQLPVVCGPDQLREIFRAAGEPTEVTLDFDRAGRPKGTGCVRFRTQAEADAAIAAFHCTLCVPPHSTPIQVRVQRGTPTGSPICSDPPSVTGSPVPPAAPARRRQRQSRVAGRKLFFGQLPKSHTDADLRQLAEGVGAVSEAWVLVDKVTGEPHGAGFVVYAQRDAARDAITRFNGEVTLPRMSTPLQVRYADGEMDKADVKLFIGQVPQSLSNQELRDLFVPFGRVVEAAAVVDREGQSRGCAFVRYSDAAHADAAIAALHKSRQFPGQRHPLIVRLATSEEDKKRMRKERMEGCAPQGTRQPSPRHRTSPALSP